MKTQQAVSRSRTSGGRSPRPNSNSSRTIGDVLGHLADAYTAPEDTVSEISDSVFQTSYLARYSYHDELVKCCAQAIEELSDLPCNSRTRADVMGRAMEFLREEYGADTPRGWYPVMKQLRARNEATVNGVHPRGDSVEDPEKGSQRVGSLEKPEEILTHSALSRSLREAAASLENQPEIRAKFVRLSAKIGVPQTCAQSIKFMATLELDNTPPEVVEVYKMLVRWERREAEAVLEWERSNPDPRYFRHYETPDGLPTIRERLGPEGLASAHASE
jgi:hypothetical protein